MGTIKYPMQARSIWPPSMEEGMAGNAVRTQKCSVTTRSFQKGKELPWGQGAPITAGVRAEARCPLGRGLARVGTHALEGRELRDH